MKPPRKHFQNIIVTIIVAWLMLFVYYRAARLLNKKVDLE